MKLYALKIPQAISHHQFTALFNQATKDRQAKARKFVQRDDILRSLAAGLLLCRVVLPGVGVQSDYQLFTYNEHGKPALANYPDIHFNLSHSGNLVVCAVDSFPIGIDIEEIQEVDLTIAQSFCTQDELSQLRVSKKADRLRYFYDLWTIKESYVKAIGQGLTFPLNSFSVHKGVVGEISLFPPTKEWFFHQYHIDIGYVLSICAAHGNFPRNVLWVDLRELSKA